MLLTGGVVKNMTCLVNSSSVLEMFFTSSSSNFLKLLLKIRSKSRDNTRTEHLYALMNLTVGNRQKVAHFAHMTDYFLLTGPDGWSKKKPAFYAHLYFIIYETAKRHVIKVTFDK